MSKQYKEADLSKKIEIIKVYEEEKLSVRKLAEKFEISKSQVQRVLKSKEDIKQRLEEYGPMARKRLKLFGRATDLDCRVFEWFSLARAKNVPVTGPILQAKALKVAEKLNLENFQASNGWLEKFKARHNIAFHILSGEGADVDMQCVNSFKASIEKLCAGYTPDNIYNLDETGLFFRATPSKSLVLKNEKCIGGKQSKERLTVALLCSASGKKEKLLVIGKAAKPRAFKNINVENHLNITWRNNSKAWMTSATFTEWLGSFDKALKKQNRKVLLFLDNAPCHILQTDCILSSIELKFLPPNCTSQLQPLDQGIIKNMKVYYRKFLMEQLLCTIEEARNFADVAAKITVLDACQWLKHAWDAVRDSTIVNCFKKSGFPGAVIDDLLQTYQDVTPEEISEYADIDEQLTTCVSLSENWETDFFQALDNQENAEIEDVSGSNSREDSPDPELEPELNISLEHALRQLIDISKFALRNDLPELAEKLNSCKADLQKKILGQSKTQSQITDFFKNN